MGGSRDIPSKRRFKPRRLLVFEGNEGEVVIDVAEEQGELEAELKGL